jgi:hypothetical protein
MEERRLPGKFDAGGAGVYGRALPHLFRASSCVPMERALSQEGGERERISVEREGQCRKVVSMQKERTML